MKREKHEEILKEVLDKIETALKDKQGLLAHQRRLAFSVSLGAVTLLEIYLHKLDVMKEGSKIDHTWFKKKKEKIVDYLQKQVITQINSITDLDKIIDIMVDIENKRNDLAYGVAATEKILQEKINLFFKLREITKC